MWEKDDLILQLVKNILQNVIITFNYKIAHEIWTFWLNKPQLKKKTTYPSCIYFIYSSLSKRGFATDINRSELWFFNFSVKSNPILFRLKKKKKKLKKPIKKKTTKLAWSLSALKNFSAAHKLYLNELLVKMWLEWKYFHLWKLFSLIYAIINSI